MLWIADHYFQNAQTEGWFDAILVQVRSHPRAIRTTEYADHCDEIWVSEPPSPYPSFEDWRRDADSYVELALTDSPALARGFLDKLFDMPLRGVRPGAITTLRNVLR